MILLTTYSEESSATADFGTENERCKSSNPFDFWDDPDYWDPQDLAKEIPAGRRYIVGVVSLQYKVFKIINICL